MNVPLLYPRMFKAEVLHIRGRTSGKAGPALAQRNARHMLLLGRRQVAVFSVYLSTLSPIARGIITGVKGPYFEIMTLPWRPAPQTSHHRQKFGNHLQLCGFGHLFTMCNYSRTFQMRSHKLKSIPNLAPITGAY